MKKTFLILFFTSLVVVSCNKTEDEPIVLTPDFDIAIDGNSPNASVSIVNKSQGAKSYSWSFSVDNIEYPSSTEETPTSFIVDNTGTLTVKLIANDGASQEKTLIKEVEITGNNAILEFTDVSFGYNNGIVDYGSYYDIEAGLMYKFDELTANNGPTIDLVFSSIGATVLFFDSPANPDYNIPGGLATKVTNYQATPDITVAEFDAMTDDTLLSGLTIAHLDDSFGRSTVPHTVLFETASGKKGVIKTKTIDDLSIIVDIKVQKY